MEITTFLTLSGGDPRKIGAPSVPVWTHELYERYTALIDTFQGYSNVLGVFIGTNVVQSSNSTDALPFLKAAIRDVKTYITEKKYRNIPVGYSGGYGRPVDMTLAEYLACGNDVETIDFLGFRNFNWCGNSSFTTSGYDKTLKDFKGYPRPVIISEYGCKTARPRFQEVAAIYGATNMTNTFSGGIAYEFYKNSDFGNTFPSG